MPNHLANESSPYLLQHAHNPVDWYPWGEEALTRAHDEGKPVLLSIGYSACHWCHVMAHESFENTEIASFMNENFINIKVDREERPDLDSVYMEAVQVITGSGGWPLTVFLTPDGSPFFGGTYFPPEDSRGMPGFLRVLRSVASAYHSRRNEVEDTAKHLLAAISKQIDIATTDEPLTFEILRQAYAALEQSFDEKNGGFGTAPKFPQPMTLEFLMRYFHRTHDKTAWDMVELTLGKMARGGIYDQLGGGFHRYSTDEHWLIPHFEKMLYDNALLSQAYLHGYIISRRQLFRTIVEETLDYVLREMTGPFGGFYSTQDADTEGVEGKYYVWTPGEIIEVAGELNDPAIIEYYGVTNQGNFEGRNILHIPAGRPENRPGIIERSKASLLSAREQRVKPGRDEKVIASWNGLMMTSLAEASCVLERPDYLAAAKANGAYLIDSMMASGSLLHVNKGGQNRIYGFLQDYALVIEGLLMLHSATFEGKWLKEGIRLAKIMIDSFWDEATGTFYDSRKDQVELVIRPRSTSDSALPSGPAAATAVLLKLARLTNDSRLEQISTRSLISAKGAASHYPLGFSHWLCALEFYLSEPREIAIIGARNDPITLELLHTLCGTWLPNKVFAAYDPNDKEAIPDLKLLADRQMINNRPTVYVCQRYKCLAPVSDSASFARQLQ